MYAALQQWWWALAVATLVSLPAAYHIPGVPLAEQHANWCGPVALAAVLQYHGDSVKADAIAKEIYLPRYHGSLNLDLLIYARRHGFEAAAGPGTEEAIKRAVARNRPVICMIRRHGLPASGNHFVVVRGYDAEGWLVDAGDGREERVTARSFAANWEACGRWMLTIEGRVGIDHEGTVDRVVAGAAGARAGGM